MLCADYGILDTEEVNDEEQGEGEGEEVVKDNEVEMEEIQ